MSAPPPKKTLNFIDFYCLRKTKVLGASSENLEHTFLKFNYEISIPYPSEPTPREIILNLHMKMMMGHLQLTNTALNNIGIRLLSYDTVCT